MNTHADKVPDNKSQPVTGGLSQQADVQFVDNRAEAAAQRKLKDMANSSPQAMQLKAYQDMANSSPQVAQLKAYSDMANNGPHVQQAAQMQAMANAGSVKSQPLQSKIVQRTVVDGENKPVDIDVFITTHMVPLYTPAGVTAEETATVTAYLKGKLTVLFEPDEDGDPPMTLDFVKSNIGSGNLNIDRALTAVRENAQPAEAVAEPTAAEPEPVTAEAEPTAAEAEPTTAVTEPVVAEESSEGGAGASGAGAEARQEATTTEAVVEPAAVEEEAGDPDSLATSMFHSLGGGKYGSTTEVQAKDVDRLVNKSIRENVKLTVLTGTHGDEKGWLIGEASFATSDTRALTGKGIIVQDVNGKSKSAIRGMIDGATTPAVLLAWCFSKVSFDDWGEIHAIFTNKEAYMELNDALDDLITEADEIYESEKQEDKDRYVVVKAEIQTTKAAMRALLDW